MAETVRVGPGFAPVYDADSRVLILGSFPSPKSREDGFYYGHPQNRFWPLLAALTGSEVPAARGEKIKLLLTHHIALWDTVQSCVITGASDSSIREAVPNAVEEVLRCAPVEAVFCNGGASWTLYRRYILPRTGVEAIRLPSTSPANAAWSFDRLEREWRHALEPYGVLHNMKEL